jgi:hypothetical protein
MSDHRPPDGHPVLRGLALWAVAAGVVVLAAAAFVLSYPGVHAVALQSGVSRSLARIYPAIFDAMLVIACAAVLSLRGGGLISRCYAWLSLLVLLAAAAGADTLHSIRVRPPHREAAAAAAIIPWALLLIGFGLLLAMLRHARLRRAAAATQVRGEPPRPNPPMAALPVGTAASAQASDYQQRRTLPELPSVADSGHEASQSPAAESPAEADPDEAAHAEGEPAEDESTEAESTEAEHVLLAAPAEPLGPQPRPEEPSDANRPVTTAPFHRMWSTPVPPDDEEP